MDGVQIIRTIILISQAGIENRKSSQEGAGVIGRKMRRFTTSNEGLRELGAWSY